MTSGFARLSRPLMPDLHSQLVDLLGSHEAPYRVIEHSPEGRTDLVSVMRGHDVSLAAKSMLMIVKIGKKVTRYVLGVVPGHMRLDFEAVTTVLGATYVSMASPAKVEELCGSVSGTVLPFSFNPDVDVIVDPLLLKNEYMYFNAARLERSFELRPQDYFRIARPRIERIGIVQRSVEDKS